MEKEYLDRDLWLVFRHLLKWSFIPIVLMLISGTYMGISRGHMFEVNRIAKLQSDQEELKELLADYASRGEAYELSDEEKELLKPIDTEIKFSFSKSYAFLGGVSGFAVGVLILLYGFVLKKEVVSLTEMKRIFPVSVYGRVRKVSPNSFDKLCEHIRAQECQTILLVSSVRVPSGKEVESFMNRLREQGITAEYCDNAPENKDFLQQYARADAIIEAEAIRETNLKTVKKLADFYRENNTKIIGLLLW